MINNEQFTKRIKKIMDYHQFTASSFADKIGVQRSSISHILSGRNKPSLDFIIKVSNAIPDVDVEWLLKGKGSYPASVTTVQREVKANSKPSLFDTHNSSSGKRINRIVVFYDDGTFDEYHKQ